jgi:toxin HigB-1
MITHIKDKQTLAIWQGGSSKKLPAKIQQSAAEKMLILHFMVKCPQDLWASPSLRCEKLSKDRAGQWSIRINDQWRICFNWEEETQSVTNVEITDYH